MDELARLFSRTRTWFEEPGQVSHYEAERLRGATKLEQALLERLHPRGKDVLDLGCGAGRLAVPLALLGNRVRGVDISAPLVETARSFALEEGAEGAVFDLVEGHELSLPPAAFDMVLSVKHLCYVPSRSMRKKLLQDVSAALRPHGHLLVVNHIVPTESDALESLREDAMHQAAARTFNGLEPLDTFSDGGGYVHWFTREALLEELSEFGQIEELMTSADGLQIGVILTRGDE